MVLLRRELGDALRDERRAQGRTLREVASRAAVSLGYLSEIERGAKEASSELLASVCGALGVPLSHLLREVATRVARSEQPLATVDSPGYAAPDHTPVVAPVALPVPVRPDVSASAA